MTQLSLLSDVQRAERPWKVARSTSRRMYYDPLFQGHLRQRAEFAGRALRYIWNRRQCSAPASRVAQIVGLTNPEWARKERTWVLYEVRKGLTELCSQGLVDKVDVGGREMFWRWREAGAGERPIITRAAS